MRICKHCGGVCPCVSCKVARENRWVEEHRERSRAIKQAWENRNPQKANESRREYYQRNRSEVIRRASDHKKADPERTRRIYREQYAKDRTPFLLRAKRRDDRDKAVGGVFTDADRNELFSQQNGRCANPYCEADLSITGFHADHKTPVLLGGSHDPSNRQLLCPTCNHRKGALANEVWLEQQRELSA